MKTVFMFSGQGSQFYNMGSKLFQANIHFRANMLALDEMVKSSHDVSVVESLYSPHNKLFDPFVKLRLTHPAIFMVGYSLAKVMEEQGIVPDYVLGCSLGEITAAAVAKIISPEVAIGLIMKQADIVENNCEAGGMIAVLQDVNTYYNNREIKNNSALAAINSPSQFVIADARGNLDTAKKFLKENEMLHQELMVSYGFHSGAIDAAEQLYCSFLKTQRFDLPSTPMVSGTFGTQLQTLSGNYFWDVVRKPTMFANAIETIETSVNGEDIMYLDLGTGSLANLIKYNVRDSGRSKGFQIVTPFQQDIKKLEEARSYYHDRKKETTNARVEKNSFVAYVFPGQGSQRKGMGQELFDIFPSLTTRASEILGYSIKDLCCTDPQRHLNKTQYTQPALFVVNALSYLKQIEDSRVKPDFVAGHSLGEYNALFAAEAFDFETGLKLVKKRGELMAQMQDGGMAAVKGLTEEEIKYVIEKNGLTEIDMANYNTHNQIVLSGPRELIARVGPYFEAAGATLYFPLNVNGAFHSRFMIPARKEFETFLQQFNFSKLKIPVVSNVEAAFYPDDRIKNLLASQLVKPVQWTGSISFLLEKGEVTFKEIGPGDVLTKLVWRIQQDLLAVPQ